MEGRWFLAMFVVWCRVSSSYSAPLSAANDLLPFDVTVEKAGAAGRNVSARVVSAPEASVPE